MNCCFFDEKTVRCIKFYLKRYRKRIVNAVNLWRWNIHVQDVFNELGSDKSRSDCKALLVDILNRAAEAILYDYYGP